MTTEFRLRFDVHGDHRHVRVFVGLDGGTLALAGTLAFREEEWRQFAGALLVGATVIQGKPHVSVEPERTGSTPLAAARGA